MEDIDTDLRNLRNIAIDCVHGSDKWVIAWERIDQLLEERKRFSPDDTPDSS